MRIAMRKGGFIFWSVCLAAVASSVADEPKVEGDLKALQGEWVSSGRDPAQVSHWSFKGNKLSLKTPTRNYRMTVELVPRQDPEKAVNFRVADDSPSAAGSFVRGIYKFTGEDTLKICVSDKEGQRPTEFKADPGGTAGDTERDFVFELKRAKK